MSTTKKRLITIYCAENLISGKKYIGQTSRPIKCRKTQHYHSAKKASHKFAEALKYYPPESWLWYSLAEVECDKANEYEAFYIRDLDTYENGYNTQKVSSFENKIDSVKYSSNICSVYRPDVGVLTGTKSELARQYPELEEIRKLLTNSLSHIRGWVLSEYKDKYEELTNRRNRFGKTITLTHKEHGTHTLRQIEFVKKFGLDQGGISSLLAKRNKSMRGWMLPENKDIYEPPINLLTLTHKNLGTHTLTRKEFREQFNISVNGLSALALKTSKSYRGWKLVEEN